jgi:hypothetical protein
MPFALIVGSGSFSTIMITPRESATVPPTGDVRSTFTVSFASLRRSPSTVTAIGRAVVPGGNVASAYVTVASVTLIEGRASFSTIVPVAPVVASAAFTGAELDRKGFVRFIDGVAADWH